MKPRRIFAYGLDFSNYKAGLWLPIHIFRRFPLYLAGIA